MTCWYSTVAIIQPRGAERAVKSGIHPLPLLFASLLLPLSISEGRRFSTTPREASAVSVPPSLAPFPFDPAAPDHPALSPPQLLPSVAVPLAVGATRDSSCTPFFPSEDWITSPFGSLYSQLHRVVHPHARFQQHAILASCTNEWGHTEYWFTSVWRLLERLCSACAVSPLTFLR